MSESAEAIAAVAAVEVEESTPIEEQPAEQPQQQPIEEEQQEQLPDTTTHAQVLEDCNEILQLEEEPSSEPEPDQESELADKEQEEKEPTREVLSDAPEVVSQGIQDTEQQQEQEEEEGEIREDPLEESKDTMQLPLENVSGRAIEDEEMPSMMVTSGFSRIDVSDSNIKQDDQKRFVDVEDVNPKSSPRKEEDDDSDSVCVIDDDDDEEDVGRAASSYDESSSYTHDDDEDEDDSEDMDRGRYDDEYDRRRRVKRLRGMQEDEDDDDEEDDEDDEDDEEGEDGEDDSEPDYFDGGSDDLVLRRNGLSKQKERSSSLQDLSLIKGRPQKPRHNVNPFSQKARFERNQMNMERRTPSKPYDHVQSKVKQYIEQSISDRKKSETPRKVQEEEYEPQPLNEQQIRRQEELVKTCNTIKDYVERGLKEVAECEQNDGMYVMPHGVGNGEISIFPRRSMGNGETQMRHEEMDVDPIEIEPIIDDENGDKINGTVMSDNENNYVSERKGIHRRDELTIKPVLNGEDPLNPVSDLRSLTYEEYMKGAANQEMNPEIINVVSNAEAPPFEKCNNNDDEISSLRIENITSNYYSTDKMDDDFNNRKTPVMMVDNWTETCYRESPEVIALQSQLQQRDVQFDKLRNTYQKTLAENLAMKMELDNLKKRVNNYEEQQNKKGCKTKTIAVQTETFNPAPSMPLIDNDENEHQLDPRIAAIAGQSIISDISTQWSDSIGSAAISTEPPSVTTALNSDESINLTSKSALQKKNALSRAFLTSSRILQTLSSITHGKSKKQVSSRSKSPTALRETIVEATTSGQSVQSQSMQTQPSGSTKRKATDSVSATPSKIPRTSKTEKGNRTLNTQEPQVVDLSDENNDTTADVDAEENTEGNDETPLTDDVKVFLYPEDETGREHSFLIQAKEVGESANVGHRECGPFLFGDLEVFMTELNGTINIWGKNRGQAADDLETTGKSKDLKSSFRWQSTPRINKYGGSASTSKKSKATSRCSHQQRQHSCGGHNTAVDFDNCSQHSHMSYACNQSIHQNHHTCCQPSIRVENVDYGCAHTPNTSCCKPSQRFSLPTNCHNNSASCCNNHRTHCTINKEACRPQSFVRRHSFNVTDEEDAQSDEDNGAQPAATENSPHSCNKLVPPSASSKRNCGPNCTEPSCENEDDPLILLKQSTEAPEVRKRKTSGLGGKKVRGLLMDLLKGCGDCRTINPNNTINNTNLQNASVYEPSTSAQQKEAACVLNPQSCAQLSGDKISTSCGHHTTKDMELEAQLDFFRTEMEKIRNQSDNLYGLLETLRNPSDN